MKLIKNLNLLTIFFSLLSFLGFLDASYLTLKHYLGTPIPCSIFDGCDVVTSSVYSQIGPVPIALIGALYYLTLIILGVFYLDSKNKKALKIAAWSTAAGFVASLFLVYLQIFVIHSLCLYCMISAATSTLLFIIGQIILRELRKENENILHS